MSDGLRLRHKRWRLWTPADITTLGWFDAQDAGTIVQADAAGRVSQWTDKGSGATNHFLQATTSAQPTTGVDTIGGFNALGFDGSAYFLRMGSNPFGASISNAAIFFVLNIKTRTSQTLFSLTGSGITGYSNRWQSHCPWNNNICYFDCGGCSGANRVSYATGWADNRNVIMGYYCSTTVSFQGIYEDGVLKASDATGHTVTTISFPIIGAIGTGAEFDNCSIGEVIIINGTVSKMVRENIEGYMAWKWGLQGNLQASHQWKAQPPLIPAA